MKLLEKLLRIHRLFELSRVQSTEVETNDDFKHWAAEVPVARDLCHVVISICRQSIQQQRVRLKCQRFEGCLDFDFPTSGTLVLVIWVL